MAAQKAPMTLGPRGKRVWNGIAKNHELDAVQLVVLEEACRVADRLEKLDEILRGDEESFLRLELPRGAEGFEGEMVLQVAGALAESRQQQNVMKQLLVSLRLEDVDTGKKPQRRGARGAHAPKVSTETSRKVVALADRFA